MAIIDNVLLIIGVDTKDVSKPFVNNLLTFIKNDKIIFFYAFKDKRFYRK